MRMKLRRFTRLTNAFSGKLDNYMHAVSLHFMNCNFCRPSATLTNANGAIHQTRQWPLASPTTFGSCPKSPN